MIDKLKLSDLKNNEEGVIVRVGGSGAFRKRITEMGFVKGKLVKVIKNAPLKDPIQYNILGYEVSLRRNEAQLIEVNYPGSRDQPDLNSQKKVISGDELVISGKLKSKNIKIALVGNPNSGKTTIFNFASNSRERVGNYSGVTIESKEANLEYKGYRFDLVDLPGTYSLSAYSPEELYVRQFLRSNKPDVIINVVDASNLERNLYLTTQLIDMNLKLVIALNMYDELQARGDKFEYGNLGKMMGVPFIPTVGSKGKGIVELFDKVIDLVENEELTVRNLNYGIELEQTINKIKAEVDRTLEIPDIISSRYFVIKLLEKDKEAFDLSYYFKNGDIIREMIGQEIRRMENQYKEDSETLITDTRYGFISGALKETYKKTDQKVKNNSQRIDRFLTHKYLGLPIFLLFMYFMFQVTFVVGGYPMEWIDNGVALLADGIDFLMPKGIFRDLLIDGMIGGVGGVIVFLPNILILFFFISMMEDTGYMARAAFLMDKVMHVAGLHGRSFIPLLMGFGCNVPAIMATRTIENRNNRLLTMLINPFMSCSARLPVYVLFIGAFFPKQPGLVLFSMYIFGILLAGAVAIIFKKLFFKADEIPFVMELPPYRIPTVKAINRHMWQKAVQYLRKMGGVILTASVIIWALETFPRNVELSRDYDADVSMIEANYAKLLEEVENENELSKLEENRNKEVQDVLMSKNAEQKEKAFLGRLGHAIEPVLKPMGFDWKMSVSILTGIAAKEIVVSTLGVLHHVNIEENSVSLTERLQNEVYSKGEKKGMKVYTPLTALCFMLFILIYFPCVAVIASVKKESGSWKWAAFTIFYTTGLAWVVSFVVYQIGGLFV